MIPEGGPDAKNGVGEPERRKKAAEGGVPKQIPRVGPTLRTAWGNPRVVRRPPKAAYRSKSRGWARR